MTREALKLSKAAGTTPVPQRLPMVNC